jgi:predicted metal-dependent hydrolase
MASHRVEVQGIGSVLLTKRKSSRSLRLSIGHDGLVRVSLPYFTPYLAGLQFVRAKADWITAQQQNVQVILKDGQRLGKAHHLILVADPAVERITARLNVTEAVVRFPESFSHSNPAVQQAAYKLGVKALRAEAEALLPKRLEQLASQHGFNYKSVQIRQLKSRWGSCSSKGDITLNLFLLQLPWELIDYVLLHELVHTKVLRHGSPFWAEFTRHLPAAKNLRRILNAQRPAF